MNTNSSSKWTQDLNNKNNKILELVEKLHFLNKYYLQYLQGQLEAHIKTQDTIHIKKE